MTPDQARAATTEVALYWLPLGADGNPAVRWGGRAYEAIAAHRDSRGRLDLFHSALQVRLGETRFVVEMAPAWGAPAAERGVVGGGSVGLAGLGRSRFFRYEIRRWRDGVIPDADQAVDSPVELGATAQQACELLGLVPRCPTPVWGRDELRTGDMWNSNSLVAWLLTRVGLLGGRTELPRQGRAPGWDAGVRVAQRQPRAEQRDLGELRVLPDRECRALLSENRIGRISWNDPDEGPVVLPVSYRFDGAHVLVRTSAHTELARHFTAGRMAFEIDQYDELGRTGWSVLVRGFARIAEWDQVPSAADGPAPLVRGVRDFHIRIAVDRVTGRLILPA